MVLALAADAEKQTGNKLIIDNDTAGASAEAGGSGEPFDVAIITPAIVDSLANSGKITLTAGSIWRRSGLVSW